MSVDARSARRADPSTLDVWTDPSGERLLTPATIITFIRTIASLVVSGFAIHEESLTLLIAALAVYWVGDTLDGFVARVGHCETRIGAVLDIMSDRFCAAGFYLGLAWLHHEYTIPVLIYLAEFMVIDNFLSIAFLAWRIRSPNYFYVIDYKIWLFSWSKPGKTVNSAIFAVILLVTQMPWLGILIACALMLYKLYALAKLLTIGLPIPPYDGPRAAPAGPGDGGAPTA